MKMMQDIILNDVWKNAKETHGHRKKLFGTFELHLNQVVQLTAPKKNCTHWATANLHVMGEHYVNFTKFRFISRKIGLSFSNRY